MEPSTSSGSSSRTTTSSHQSHPDQKTRPDGNFEIELEAPVLTNNNIPPPPPKRWYTSIDRRLATNAPRLYRKVMGAVEYVKGPRPKLNLPEPIPFLDINIRTQAGTVKLPLETALVSVTRPFTKPWLLILFGAAYIVSLAFLVRSQSYLTPVESWIGCTSAFWLANDGCGVDGLQCLPFDIESYNFRCPAQCNSVILENPRTVGNEQAVYVPLIVGGGDPNRTYRGDSFICAAANQAGLSTNSKGGCFSLQLVGNYTDFIPFTAHGLSSLGFPSVFPSSFQLSPTTSLTHCTDLRNFALIFNVIVTCALILVLRPKPLVLVWCLASIGFWHISLFSEAQSNPPALHIAFGAFLPTLFVVYGFWRMTFRFTLPAFSKAPIELLVLFIAPFWVGVLANITTDVPIDRLLASDIRRRPGAVTALVVVVVVIFLIVVNQIRVIRKTGWLPWYGAWYIGGGLVLLVLSQLPGLTLRLHHYIIAMIFIPGTAFPTRLSLVYQGFLLGLFLNGVAGFGFAPILQTAADLVRDGTTGSALPVFLTNSTTFNSSIPFADQVITWESLPDGWDGYALLVDDVERYVGTAFNFSLASLNASIPHFFRLALTDQGLSGDFTMPAVLWPNGTWVDPPAGAS